MITFTPKLTLQTIDQFQYYPQFQKYLKTY